MVARLMKLDKVPNEVLDKLQLRAGLHRRRPMTQADRRRALIRWGGSTVLCLLFTFNAAWALAAPRPVLSRIAAFSILLMFLFMTLIGALLTFVRVRDWQYGRTSQIIRQYAGNNGQAQ